MAEQFSGAEECFDEAVVRRLFVFLKNNLDFNALQDEFIQRNLLSERERKDYVLPVPGKHYRSEKFLKLIISKRRCTEFISCMQQIPAVEQIYQEIWEFKERTAHEGLEGSRERMTSFSITNEMLQNHFIMLYNELEPRVIADEMFQAGDISKNDHDDVTDDPIKYQRLRNLLEILKRKQLCSSFLFVLESLQKTALLHTLKTGKQSRRVPSERALLVQHNFTTLQIELPDPDCAVRIMEQEVPDPDCAVRIMEQEEDVLRDTDVFDIQHCRGTIRQNSKLIKILISKGQHACKKLIEAIRSKLQRHDLIQRMENRHEHIRMRGTLNLRPSLRCLTTSCLPIYEKMLYEELEPIELSDFLFEENAVDIFHHDKITESIKRRKQTEYLLERLKNNEDDCFNRFLYILQREGYEYICQELEKRTPSPMEVDGMPNDPIQLRLTVKYDTGEKKHKILFQHIHSFDTTILKEVISKQTDIERVTFIAVAIQIRPPTGNAIPTKLDENERKKLMRKFSKMVEEAETCLARAMGTNNPLQIRMQVQNYSWEILKSDNGISRAAFIKDRVKVHRNILVSGLDPMDLIPALSKCKAFPKSVLESLPVDSCERIQSILGLVENGSDDVAIEFVTALNDQGYYAIVEMIDPSQTEIIAENIRKRIMWNYKDILDEMQLTLAKETLSRCIANFDEIMKKIVPATGNRRQRMSEFLHFVLQNGINMIEFERTLKKNGLRNIIDTWQEHGDSRDLQILLESFDVVIPKCSRKSLANVILEGQLLTEFVKEVKSLAKRVKLCKSIDEKNLKPGTVCVFDMIVNNVNDRAVVYEKNPDDRSAFFDKTHQDVVKVIMIEGTCHDVSEAKKIVHQKYKEYIDSGEIHLHHVSESFFEVTKLSATKKIKLFKQHVESISISIPLHNIHDIVMYAANRALSQDTITELCCGAYIDGIGNVYSGSYKTRSIFTLNKIKVELRNKTNELIVKEIRSNLCLELMKHIRLQPQSILRLELIQDVLNMAMGVALGSMLFAMLLIVNPVGSIVAGVVVAIIGLAAGINVNSKQWREEVAVEIYNEVTISRSALINKITSQLREAFIATSNDLSTVAENLEEFRRRIDLIN